MITIAVAVYNVEAYIEKCIVSALNQDFEGEYEVLVVDDCGQDNSIGIVERLASTHPNGRRIRIVHHEQNIGTGAARNTGIDEAKGEYICFMDGDDYMAPNALRLFYEAMVDSNADIVVSNHYRIYPDGKIDSTTNNRPGIVKSEYAVVEWIRYNNSDFYPLAMWNKLFRTSFLRDNGIRCVPWHRYEDPFFSLQTAFIAKSIITIPELTYYWVLTNGSCTHSEVTDSHVNQFYDMIDRSLALCEEKRKEGKAVPKEIYWLLTHLFFWTVITKRTLKSSAITKKQKKEYLDHVKEITRYIKRSDESDWKHKAVHTIVRMPCSYELMKLFAFSLGTVEALKSKFNNESYSSHRGL